MNIVRSHIDRLLLPVVVVVLVITAGGCSFYGFKFGSPPPHISSIYIPTVEDNSGYGRGTVRQELTEELINKFRDDNSLQVRSTREADSQLDVVITSIRSVRSNLSGESFESVRDVIIDVRATWVDNVKGGSIYEQSFSGRGKYNLNQGAQGEQDAIEVALGDLTTQILDASVSMW
jgi:hypothetical protein